MIGSNVLRRTIVVGSALSAICMTSIGYTRVNVEPPLRRLETRNIRLSDDVKIFKIGDVVAIATLSPRGFAKLPHDVQIDFYGYKATVSSKMSLFDANFISYPHDMSWVAGYGYCTRADDGGWNYQIVGPFSDFRKSSSSEDNKLNAFKGIICLTDLNKSGVLDQARIVAKSNGREVGPVSIPAVPYTLEDRPDLSPASFEISVADITPSEIKFRTCFKHDGKCRGNYIVGVITNGEPVSYQGGCRFKIDAKDRQSFDFLLGTLSMGSIDIANKTFQASYKSDVKTADVYFVESVMIYDFHPNNWRSCGSAR